MARPGIRIRLTKDVERGVYKGVVWTRIFHDIMGAEYEVAIKDRDAMWVDSKKTGLRIKLHPDEYEIVDSSRPTLRLV